MTFKRSMRHRMTNLVVPVREELCYEPHTTLGYIRDTFSRHDKHHVVELRVAAGFNMPSDALESEIAQTADMTRELLLDYLFEDMKPILTRLSAAYHDQDRPTMRLEMYNLHKAMYRL